MFGHAVKGYSAALKLAGQLLTANQGAVGHQNFVNARLQQVHGGQLGHFARAHQQGLVPVHVAEDAFGKLHGGIADGYSAGGHGRFGAHAFGHRKGLVQQPVEDDARGVALHGFAVGGLELPQNLRLAQHHGIKAGSHGKQSRTASRFLCT